MLYNDPLSQKSLKEYPNWPPKYWFQDDEEIFRNIEEELSRICFDFEEWLKYKKNVPNDGRPRPHNHPDVEYSLTDEELEAFKNQRFLCSPLLCPKNWESQAKNLKGEVEKSLWWLGMQMNWVMWGYPSVPKIIWNHNRIFLRIYSELVNNPFIAKWGSLPDDFWVKLSYHLEAENEDMVLRGLILLFKAQNRIFPSPSLYIPKDDPNPQSLNLPPDFWR